MLTAIRDVFAVNERAVTYLPYPSKAYTIDGPAQPPYLCIHEDASQVDGIGGVLWEGALLLNQVLSRLSLQGSNVIEFGCGTGLCGLFAASCGAHTLLTDREIDLATSNVSRNDASLRIDVAQLTWSTDPSSFPDFDHSFDVLIGAEITVLNKQHALLVATLRHYTSSHSLILLTFDGPPPPRQCTYAQRFVWHMSQLHYQHETVAHGHITWSRGMPDGAPSILDSSSGASLRREFATVHNCSQSNTDNSSSNSTTEHHVVGFYLPSAARTCSRCHASYHPLLNRADACVHHSGLFVCRYHPAEANCSIDGLGDNLGYYCDGDTDWPAKFWDCCGSVDPQAAGCTHSEHVPYT